MKDYSQQEHYTQCSIEPIAVIRSEFDSEMQEGFYLGNIIKYIMRYRYKNGVEDLRKAQVYLDWLIKSMEADE